MGPGVGRTGCLFSFSFVFSFCSLSFGGREKEIGEPHYDGWILRLHGWMLDGDEIWIYL